jgi:hypothetical protein
MIPFSAFKDMSVVDIEEFQTKMIQNGLDKKYFLVDGRDTSDIYSTLNDFDEKYEKAIMTYDTSISEYLQRITKKIKMWKMQLEDLEKANHVLFDCYSLIMSLFMKRNLSEYESVVGIIDKILDFASRFDIFNPDFSRIPKLEELYTKLVDKMINTMGFKNQNSVFVELGAFRYSFL